MAELRLRDKRHRETGVFFMDHDLGKLRRRGLFDATKRRMRGGERCRDKEAQTETRPLKYLKSITEISKIGALLRCLIFQKKRLEGGSAKISGVSS